MITSLAYFKGEIHIPNAMDVANSSSLLGNAKQLERFIEEYERDVLFKCLGPLYNEFQDNLEVVAPSTLQTIKADAPQKWKDFFNGKQYSVDGVTMNWKGIKFQLGGFDFSLISYYTYFYYLQSDLSHYVGTGVQVEKSKNAVHVDPTPKLVRAWNKFYELTVKGRQENERSLYQFIEDMNDIDPSNFPSWTPTVFNKMNRFGI